MASGLGLHNARSQPSSALPLTTETGMGVLLSLAGARLAIVSARLLRVGRLAR
jgi:hypothetical protein